MKKKLVLILIILVLILGIGFYVWQNLKNEDTNNVEFEEYTPVEEISEEQERKTLVTLYFINKETKELMPEARLIDAKLLLNNPYKELVNLLIQGPKNEKLQSIIPKGTKINSAKLDKNTVILDLSEEFIKGVNEGITEETKIVYSIVNTLVELTEIESLKILINGKENISFEDNALDFSKEFKRIT